MKKHLRTIGIILLVIFALFQLTGCGNTSETKVVGAEVIDKEYVESYLDYGYHYDVWKGKFRWKFKNMPEEYHITVQYEDIIKTFDSKSLYEAYEVGNILEVNLTTYYDSDGNVTSQYISSRN